MVHFLDITEANSKEKQEREEKNAKRVAIQGRALVSRGDEADPPRRSGGRQQQMLDLQTSRLELEMKKEENRALKLQLKKQEADAPNQATARKLDDPGGVLLGCPLMIARRMRR